jgi:predicted transcriptional regulator
MTISVRLDPASRSHLERLARRTGRTKSEVIRDALQRLARGEEACRPRTATAYDAIRHLIGCAKGGPPGLSIKTGRGFRTALAEKRKRR